MNPKYPQLSSSFVAAVARGDPGLRSAVNNLNRAVEVFQGFYGAREISIPLWSDLSLAGGSVVDHVLLDLSYFVNVTGRRLGELFSDLVESLERRRLAVSALVAGAIIETSAAVVYAEDRVLPLLNDSEGPRVEDLEKVVAMLHQFSGGARFDWLSWHGSTERRTQLLAKYESAKSVTDEPAPDESIRAVNVMTMLKRLDTRFLEFARSVGQTQCSGAVVRATYAMLSDHCHPASGAYMLYVKPADVHLAHTFTSNATNDTVHWFFKEMMGYVAPIGHIADRALIEIGKAANQLAAQSGRGPAAGQAGSLGTLN